MVCYSWLLLVGALFCAALVRTVDCLLYHSSVHIGLLVPAQSKAKYLHRYVHAGPTNRCRTLYMHKGSHKHIMSNIESVPATTTTNTSTGMIQNIKDLLSGNGWNGALTKDSIAKLGLNVLLAYGFVSNVSYITCVIIAWISHGRLYGKSPLAVGQWKAFLLIYSGLFAANNVIRPLRFSLSLVLSPFFDAQIVRLRNSLGLSRAVATGLLVFLVNIVGTISYLVGGLLLATKYFKVPLLS